MSNNSDVININICWIEDRVRGLSDVVSNIDSKLKELHKDIVVNHKYFFVHNSDLIDKNEYYEPQINGHITQLVELLTEKNLYRVDNDVIRFWQSFANLYDTQSDLLENCKDIIGEITNVFPSEDDTKTAYILDLSLSDKNDIPRAKEGKLILSSVIYQAISNNTVLYSRYLASQITSHWESAYVTAYPPTDKASDDIIIYEKRDFTNAVLDYNISTQIAEDILMKAGASPNGQ